LVNGANTITVISTAPDGKVKASYFLHVSKLKRISPILPFKIAAA